MRLRWLASSALSPTTNGAAAVVVVSGRRLIGTHVDAAGNPGMVNVCAKTPTQRQATARSTLALPPTVSAALRDHLNKADAGAANGSSRLSSWAAKKGPIQATCVIAATMAVKNTPQVIPFCHPLPIEGCQVDCEAAPDCTALHFRVTVSTTYKTGVEMEALHGATVAALTAYDMLKGIEGAQPGLRIESACLEAKSGGKSDIGE